MTARQLLSILRLSQALARLRLDNTIKHEDVDEAIRLTGSSKESLKEDGPSSITGNQEDLMSQIYSVIRDYANQQPNNRRLSYAHVEQMVLNRGFPVQAMQSTIREYTGLGVLYLDPDGTHIIFED